MAALIRFAMPLAVAFAMLASAIPLPPGQAFSTLPARPKPKPATSAEPVSRTLAVERWRVFIAEAARHFAIPERWIAAVMAAESGGLTTLNGRPITSQRGAMGLMQLMPQTWAVMRAAHHLGSDPYDPRENILAGTAYLRAMYDRFGYPGLFAAYNAGPARYAEHLASGVPLPGETRAYLSQLAKTPAAPDMPPAILSGTRLFFMLDGNENPAAPRAENPPSGGLFAPLHTASGDRR